MPSQLIDELVQEVDKKLGNRSFYTLPQLVSLGLFGTVQTARKALKNGELPFVRPSPRRCVIPRQCLIQYLKSTINKPM